MKRFQFKKKYFILLFRIWKEMFQHMYNTLQGFPGFLNIQD